jgi:Fe-S cluster biogenesis protein NfuA/nitrite reductase/ring-hydroxylating ferredoxin subunit
MSEEKEVQRRIQSIEGLIRDIEKVPDPAVRSLLQRLVQSLMDLHGAGLERIVEITHRAGGNGGADSASDTHGAGVTGQSIIDELGRDNLVRSLLLLYGLHPLGLQERVVEALEKTRPYLRSHGGNVQLVHVTDSGAVTLRLEGSCHSCPSSAVTLQSTVEQAIYDAAPDVTAIIVEGAIQEANAPGTFVPLAQLQGNGEANCNGNGSHTGHGSLAQIVLGETEWEDVSGLDGIPPGTLQKQEVGGQAVLLCKLNEDFYAYGVTCPGCGQSLEGGRLEDTILACPICRQRFDLVHAGRGVDLLTLHLEPIPLLQENGRARVAIISRVQGSAR